MNEVKRQEPAPRGTGAPWRVLLAGAALLGMTALYGCSAEATPGGGSSQRTSDRTTDETSDDETSDDDTYEDDTYEDASVQTLPDELLGSWCGGSNHDAGGHYTWTFEADGSFSAFNANFAFEGLAVLEDPYTLTIYPTEGPARSYDIYTDGGLLFLNDFSYVHAAC